MDELLLLSGNDLPFIEAQLIVHQPRLKEIAFITEQRFWPGCQLFKFDKEILPDQDKNGLANISNFDIIMMMMQEKSPQAQQAKVNVLSVLAIIFPMYQITFSKKTIHLRNHQDGEVSEINNENFEFFKEILINMFCLKDKGDKSYNPSGELAKKIANKIKKGHEQRAKLAPSTKIAILSRYASILAVGENKDLNILMNYTVYQLMDEFSRFQLKLHYDQWLKYKIAGATGLEDPQDWLKDLYE